jgi:hypothetical protein
MQTCFNIYDHIRCTVSACLILSIEIDNAYATGGSHAFILCSPNSDNAAPVALCITN